MKIITNEPLIKRNRTIGQVTTIGSLVVLAGGLYLSFQSTNPQLLNYSFLALLVGFLLSQVGIYFGNRWGRHPRPDEQLSAGLKGLEDKYTIYHYTTPVSHLLLGPSGVLVLLPLGQGGTISFDKNRWKQKGGNWYLKLFAQDSIGRPDLEVNSAITDIKRFLTKKMPDVQMPDIQAVLVFTNEKVTLATEETPFPAVKLDKLKDFIRKEAKSSRTSPELIASIEDALEN